MEWHQNKSRLGTIKQGGWVQNAHPPCNELFVTAFPNGGFASQRLLVQIFTSLVDDKAFRRFVDALAHHVVNGSIDTIHRRGRALTMPVGTDGLDGCVVQDFLQARQTVNLAEAGLCLVARRNHRWVGGEVVVDTGGLQHLNNLVGGHLWLGL